jgi:hypothetical protein
MCTIRGNHRTPAAVLAALLMLPACSVTAEQEDREGGKAAVDIHTPLGDVSVRTNVDGLDTGLPVYPGARPLHEDDGNPGNARVNVGSPLFHVKVVAARFEDDDAPETIVDFYRTELRAYGSVTECRGNIDFKGARRPVCREKRRSREVQLATGTENDHRLVVVKRRGDGSEFALVSVRTRDEG